MGIIEIVLTAIGLSMDAFAVSVCKGLSTRGGHYRNIFIIALFFGTFQALMPLIGWFMGSRLERYIDKYDHWIAFIFLFIIGGKMAWEAVREGEEDSCTTLASLNYKELFLLAIATSIDALAVGVTFAFLKVDIIPSIAIIGGITFLLSICGVLIGIRFGKKYKKKAQIVGGAILILIGIKILLDNFGVFNVLPGS